MRTIIVSDLHGNDAPLERALVHSGFSENDRLIVAGDLLDGGAEDTVSRAEQLGATILAGNHEVSAALGILISPQDEATRRRAPELRERFASGAWPLAVAVEGWLVTHAGVSAVLGEIIERHQGEPTRIADSLNAAFQAEFQDAVRQRRLSWTDLERYRLIGGPLGPLWFRPLELSLVPSGLRQIVGHTPPELLGERMTGALAAAGWLLIEPGGHRGAGPGFRYAVVEHGVARVVEGAA